MLDLLLVGVLTLHLAAVGLAGVGPLAAVCVEWRGRRQDQSVWEDAARRMAQGSLAALLVGMLTGGAALAGIWLLAPGAENPYFQTLARLPRRRLWFGAVELVFSLACIAAYVGTWRRLAGWRWLHRLLAVIGATNLLYHFAPLFATAAMLSARPGPLEAVGGELSHGQFLALMVQPAALWRAAHWLLAAVGFTALCLAWQVTHRADSGTDTAARRLAVWACRWALAAVLIQLPVGMFVLWNLSSTEQARLLGGDRWAAGWLLAGIVAALGMMHQLGPAALGEVSRRTVRRALALMLLVLLCMVAARHRARLPIFRPPPRQIGAAALAPERRFMTIEVHRAVYRGGWIPPLPGVTGHERSTADPARRCPWFASRHCAARRLQLFSVRGALRPGDGVAAMERRGVP